MRISDWSSDVCSSDLVEDAVRMALDDNPALQAAQAENRAAAYDVKVADVEDYPRLSAVGGLNHYDYLDSLAPGTGPRNRDQGTTGYVGMQLKIPIYQGGRLASPSPQARKNYGITIKPIAYSPPALVASTLSAFPARNSTCRLLGLHLPIVSC